MFNWNALGEEEKAAGLYLTTKGNKKGCKGTTIPNAPFFIM